MERNYALRYRELEASMVFAVEAFIVDMQCAFHDEMRKAKVTRSELAKRIGCHCKDVDRFFSDDCADISPRFLAMMAFELGLSIDLKLTHKGTDNAK